MNERQFCVVQSDDGRLSLWPSLRDIPWGWFDIGFTADEQSCLAHISCLSAMGATEARVNANINGAET